MLNRQNCTRLYYYLKEIGEALNEYFSSVFTQEKDNVVEENTEIQAIRLDGIEVHKEKM